MSSVTDHIDSYSKGKNPRKDPYFKRPHLLTQSHEDQFNDQCIMVSRIKKIILESKYDDKTSNIKKYLEFVRSFATKGVQGIVGFVKILENNLPLVFKTSLDINRSIEHEYQVLEELNDMRKYCPHFVRSVGMIEIPIASKFIKNPYDNSLFINEKESGKDEDEEDEEDEDEEDEEDETLPRNVIFMEYVNKLSFHRLCEDVIGDKNIIISQILQILIALEVAQIKKNFTHYDLHTSNILIQMCEINSVFVYQIKGKKYAIPTYGFFPLIIDTGLSYIKTNDGKQMMSNTENYGHGFQSTVYDKLNDAHHFLLSTFYHIESESDAYDSLSNKIKIMFSNIPLLRKSGWKKLPNELNKEILMKLKEECRSYRKFELFDEYDSESLEILNGLIKLPMTDHGEKYTSFSECFPIFMIEYHKLINIDDFSKEDVLFVLITIVDTINLYTKEYKRCDNSNISVIIKKFKNKFKECVSVVLKNNINYDINYEKLLVSGIVFGRRLETNYYRMIDDNNIVIDECYKKTNVKSPIDIMNYISKNMTPHFILDNNTIVYYWDIDHEMHARLNCNNLSISVLDKINISNFCKKGDIIISELH
jgi:hypothetical protein